MTKTVILALDKSVRSKSVDGQLFVEVSPISKACVCPYLGSEIPDGDRLGLDMGKIYNLYRDPVELAKGADSFRGVPVLIIHKPTSAEAHPQELTVGAVGTDVAFNAPYLEASLSIWMEEAIVGIETKAQTEISSGYHYRADMTPGEVDGVAYDGVMRDIKGNHIALVDVGRAGPDVVVLDKKPLILRKQIMPTKQTLTRTAQAVSGAVRAYLTPKLAQDAAIGSLGALLVDVKRATYAKQRPEIIRRIVAHMGGKLAEDADLSTLGVALDAAMDDPDMAEDADEDESDEDKAARLAKEAKAGAKDADPDDKDQPVKKSAMDAAIKAAVAANTQAMNDLHQARRDVAPMVGECALDSAEAVYRFALDKAGVPTAGVHASALATLVTLTKERKPAPAAALGMDSAAAKQAATMFPGLARFNQ